MFSFKNNRILKIKYMSEVKNDFTFYSWKIIYDDKYLPMHSYIYVILDIYELLVFFPNFECNDDSSVSLDKNIIYLDKSTFLIKTLSSAQLQT